MGKWCLFPCLRKKDARISYVVIATKKENNLSTQQKKKYEKAIKNICMNIGRPLYRRLKGCMKINLENNLRGS